MALTRARDHLILCGVLPEEMPESIEACRTRTDWLAFSLGLCEDVYATGAVSIHPPGEARPIRIEVCTTPDAIPAEVRTATPRLLTIPEDIQPAPELPPATPPKEEHVYSVSEIEDFMRGQEVVDDDARIRGLIIHEVFRGRDPAAVLRRYGIEDEGRAGEYTRLYEEFRRSPLVQGAVSDHCEVPFRAEIEGVIFTGFIDRLLRRPDGTWILIDYKTGRVDEARIREHALQMAVYRRAAEEILGEPVRTYLYSTDTGRFIEVEEENPEALLQAIREIEEGRAP